ncbi:hypothetical protein MGYG_04095 [Nannizzia gypsea CBS 118893]|uniref:Peptidase C13 family protein n=1 Tax=Arthroderma gypseum (strain ATCC MYA-4604 / CBS 118893) TaxID=535722 RepID=E4UUX4_ARTGP|nr:hypothetical protein MGYG_04095 [Nannizzia gypsea CBS 118893]EFR01091.1 hypothetical protein MGYG_04095 [Nannizzia gypsea CBS 118893]
MALKLRDMPDGFIPVDRIQGRKEALADIAFKISCPPDISPTSRVVAVCGVTDYDGQASPSVDGWFFSDFYLFHHLLSPMHVTTQAQVWLTAESPESLVQKYGEYAHGDPRKERRVVLDKDTLGSIERAGNIRVVPSTILLERFLATVREQSRIAAQHNEQLIVLIFGHGDQDTHGICLGQVKEEAYEPQLLFINDFHRATTAEAKVTLFTTACYSGGWLVQPICKKSTGLNVTGITGSGIKQETRSWSLSRSVGRACGSSIASAIVQSVVGIEDEGQERMNVLTHPTYMGLAASIFKTVSNIHSLADQQGIHFYSQNDEWEMHFGRRTGFSLEYFREGWSSLRPIPPSGTKSPGDNDPTCTSTSRTGSINRQLSIRAREYLSSKPGADNLGGNVAFHAQLRKFIRGELDASSNLIPKLLDTVLYRLVLLQEANEYVQAMGIEFPNIFGYDVDKWKATNDEQKKNRWIFWEEVRMARLFDPPLPGLGYHYSKPLIYLSLALAESCITVGQAKDRISLALEAKELRVKAIVAQAPVEEVMGDKNVAAHGSSFYATMRNLGHRVRLRIRPATAHKRV